ncbi:MAG: ribosome maturation factor RimM [Chthonomonadales bacterium]
MPDSIDAPKPASTAMPEWDHAIGRIVGVFGIKGEMKVMPETNHPAQFESLKEVCLRRGSSAQTFKVRRVRFHKGMALMSVTGINRIEDVELWRGAFVQIKREEAAPLDEGSYFTTDLVGLNVVTVDGREIGPVDKVLHYPAQDLLKVGDALIPAVKPIVVEVDLVKKRILIDPPMGMLPGEVGETVEPEPAEQE